MTRNRRAAPARPWILLSALLLVGCGRLPDGRGWGEDVTIAPGWERVRLAARDAALAPSTWVPAGAALAFGIGDADQEVSDWAVDHTPLFGSRMRAREASTFLHGSCLGAYLATTAATPVSEEGGTWFPDKCRGVAVGAAAVIANHEATMGLKRATDRMRPDKSNRESFPSGHASGAAVYAALASKNIDVLAMPEGARAIAKWGVVALSAGTAWGRVEGGRHFPSDVLAGMALGNFVGTFVNDAFLGLDHTEGVAVMVGPGRGDVALGLCWSF